MAVGGQAIRHAADPGTQTNLRQHNIDTNNSRIRLNKVRIGQLWRAQAAEWHNAFGKRNPAKRRDADIVTGPQDTPPIVTRQIGPYGGRIPTCPTGVRFHIQQESGIPASALYNQICFTVAARHRRASLSSTRQLAMQTGFTTQSARSTDSSRTMAWLKPWPGPGSTCATSRSPRKQEADAHTESGHHRSRPRSA